MKSILIFVTAAALSPGSTEAFATPPPANNAARPSITSLSMSGDSNPVKTFAASALAAAYLFAGVVSSPAGAAYAADYDDALPSSFADSSSVVVAARSGGRAGGRAMPRAVPRAMPRSSSTTVINHRTIVAPPVVMGGGYGYGGYGGGYGGYGYDPTPGIGEFMACFSPSPFRSWSSSSLMFVRFVICRCGKRATITIRQSLGP